MNVFKLKEKKFLSSLIPSRKNANNRRGENKLSLTDSNKAIVRFVIIWFILILGSSYLGWQLYKLQIIRGDELQKEAKQRQSYNFQMYIPRRSIVDANNNVIATDKVVYSLYVHPTLLPQESLDYIAGELAVVFPNKQKKDLVQK